MSLFSLFSIKLMNLHFLKKNLTFLMETNYKSGITYQPRNKFRKKCRRNDRIYHLWIFQTLFCYYNSKWLSCHSFLVHSITYFKCRRKLFDFIFRNFISQIYRNFINAIFWNCYHETSKSKQIDMKKFRAFKLLENCNILTTK